MSDQFNNDVLCGVIFENGECSPIYCNQVTGECYFPDPVMSYNRLISELSADEPVEVDPADIAEAVVEGVYGECIGVIYNGEMIIKLVSDDQAVGVPVDNPTGDGERFVIDIYGDYDEDCYDDPSKLFASAYILSAFASDSEATDETIEDELDKLKIYKTYNGDDYALGKTRDALNEALSLDRARGRILSRPVGPFEVGRRVDDEVLHYIHLHCINEIYVKAIPDVVGYTLTQELVISFVPAGTHNNSRLQEALPEFADYSAIPQDSQVCIFMSSKETLTKEDVQFLYDVGAHHVDCKRPGSAPIRATFEEEVIGNYTVRLGDIYGHNIPAGRFHDEWVCFYNNPKFERTDMDHLNTHDLMALYSLCASIKKNPEENFLLDKDFGLLKKVLAANELFSNAMREVLPDFVKHYSVSISRAISQNLLTEGKFAGLSDMWKKYLWDKNYHDTCHALDRVVPHGWLYCHRSA